MEQKISSVKERRRGLKRRLEAEQQEEVKNKFVANVPKLLLEAFCPSFASCMLFEVTHSYLGYF
jgi:hypothetical protein